MKRALFVAGSLSALSLFACVGGDDSAAPPSDEDAGTLPDSSGADASLSDAAPPATSDSSADANDTSDSATSDAGDSSATTDAAPTTLFVHVARYGGFAQGVTIVFGDANGAVLSSATTDATGSLSQTFAPGTTQVTALLSGRSAQTVVGVQAGDVLGFVDTTSFPGDQIVGVTLPPTPPDASAYEVRAGRDVSGDQPAGPWSIDLTPPLAFNASGEFPLVATALGGDAGSPFAFSFQKGNVLVADAGPYAMTGAWSTTYGTETVTLANAPDGGPSANVIVTEVVGGVPSPVTPIDFAAVNPIAFGTHPGFADTVQCEAEYFGTSLGNGGSCRGLASSAAAATNGSATIDLSQLLPEITAATVDTSDAARPVVTWTASGSLAPAVGVATIVSWTAALDGGAAQSGSWTIVAPATATSLRVPELPSSAGAWAPPSGASVGVAALAAFGGSAMPSYALVRPSVSAFTTLTPTCEGPLVPPLPRDGSLAITLWTPAIP